jgi:hypothetical protein
MKISQLPSWGEANAMRPSRDQLGASSVTTSAGIFCMSPLFGFMAKIPFVPSRSETNVIRPARFEIEDGVEVLDIAGVI